jgi:hypothetical protein
VVYRAKYYSLSKKTYPYTGKDNKPSVTIKDSKGNVISTSNYSLSYKNNIKPGQATVVITFKNLYAGTVEKHFTIKPSKGQILKLVNSGKRKIKLTWKKCPSIGGYEINVAKNKAMTSGLKTLTVKSSKKIKNSEKACSLAEVLCPNQRV